VQVSFLSPLTAHAQLKAGKVKALAVSSATRFAGSPRSRAAEAASRAWTSGLWFASSPRRRREERRRQAQPRDRRDPAQPGNAGDVLEAGRGRHAGHARGARRVVKTELARWTPVIQATGIKAD